MNIQDGSSQERGSSNAGNGVSVSTTVSVVVAAIAVLLGFLILRDINSDTSDSAGNPAATTLAPGDSSAPTLPVATTLPTRTGFKILVANASGITGSAGQMSTALQSENFIVTQPINADATIGKQSVTIVYYVAGYEGGATAVADILGGVQIQPVATPAPVEGGSLGEAQVLVLLGTDLAGKLLPGALPGSTTETTTTTTIAG
ncbi:unannotated protein [freshwater metagenome]|uniref:Unannotated protein n=1 Tax=freshwater metagenome TaxID=449393 RepID=A0A6J6BNA7_9ZZZZ|nr:hypothetical protein [Actinomycetota bacterium]MTA09868.1 hypothetical protein [Actinomycetota bacterium]MTA69006.1 hypothetical protein [Actinomycetota bacterium]MTB11619.1 hypothetical protein [Actinomycetota bacterium]